MSKNNDENNGPDMIVEITKVKPNQTLTGLERWLVRMNFRN